MKTCNIFLKTRYMFSPLLGGQENLFWTWDLRQSISRARKPMYWTSGIKCHNKRIHFYSTIQGGSHLGVILRKTFFSRFLTYIGVKSCENRLRAFPKRENASLTLIQGRNRCIEAKTKHFRIFMRKPSIYRVCQKFVSTWIFQLKCVYLS